MNFILHVPCGTPITLRRYAAHDQLADYLTVTYCGHCSRDVPKSELSSPGPYSAVLAGEEDHHAER